MICYWLRKERTPISDVAINKRDLNERDICSKFIGPAVKRAGWDGMMQIREEVAFTKGRIIVRGKLVTRGKESRGRSPSPQVSCVRSGPAAPETGVGEV